MENIENKFDLPYGSTSDIINKLIKSLNLKRAKGPDDISAKLVKMSGNVLDSHFANTANNDISLNKYSKHAKTTTVRPNFKKDNITNIKNYRPVSLFKYFLENIRMISR